SGCRTGNTFRWRTPAWGAETNEQVSSKWCKRDKKNSESICRMGDSILWTCKKNGTPTGCPRRSCRNWRQTSSRRAAFGPGTDEVAERQEAVVELGTREQVRLWQAMRCRELRIVWCTIMVLERWRLFASARCTFLEMRSLSRLSEPATAGWIDL